MAAVLRRLLHPWTRSTHATSPAMLLLVRCCSSASLSAAASAEEMATDTYCYALGEFGMMKFDRKKFIPLEKFMKANSVFERVPTDRLISPNSFSSSHPYFTSESAKQWMRAGFLQVYFANKLKLSVSGAFVDGNVGVIEGINIIAFLKLDTNLSSSSSSSVPEPYPMTFAGFSSFLRAKMREAYPDANSMSEGLNELMRYAVIGKLPNGKHLPDNVIIHHPEFLPLEVIASLYIEAHRILRRQLPANGQRDLAYDVILDLHVMLGDNYFNTCASDPMVNGWLGYKQQQPGLLGAFGIPAPTGAQCNMGLLTKLERNQLEVLTRKVYSIPAPSTTAPASSSASTQLPVTGSNKLRLISKNPSEARVLDVHRHCTVHIVEDQHVARCSILPPDNQASFQKNPMCWKDGVHLMLHRFGRYPHCVVMSFQMHMIWEMLGLPSRYPIPQIFSSPPFRHDDV